MPASMPNAASHKSTDPPESPLFGCEMRKEAHLQPKEMEENVEPFGALTKYGHIWKPKSEEVGFGQLEPDEGNPSG